MNNNNNERQRQAQQQPLSLTPPQQQQQQQQQPQTIIMGGQRSPNSTSGSSMNTDPFMSGATIVSNTVSSYTALPTSLMSGSSAAGTGGPIAAPGISGAAALAAAPAAKTTPPEVVITSSPKIKSCGNSLAGSHESVPPYNNNNRNNSPHHRTTQQPTRRHTIPSSIMLSPLQIRHHGATPPTHPVPEFLCHLYSMLLDPALSNLICWIVPPLDETADGGGGKAGIGKIVVHDPTRLQDEVLGRYYRHSKYSSFQRQLNYFGFKKRLHGSKKGKMCPCSFVHDTLGPNPQSLLNLKRRPPSGKNKNSSAMSVASGGDERSSLDGKKKTAEDGSSSSKQSRKGSPLHLIKIKNEKKRSANALQGSNRRSCSSIVIPSSVSIGSSMVQRSNSTYSNMTGSTTMSSNNDKANASWGTGGAKVVSTQGGLPAMPAPLNMPIMAQVATTLPMGNAWPLASQMDFMTPNLNGAINPMFAANGLPAAADALKNSANNTSSSSSEMARANNVVLEAKKSLAANFLKSQREQQQKDAMDMGRERTSTESAVDMARKLQRQLQSESAAAPSTGNVVVQSHQPALSAMPMPNRFPNPFAAATMNDGITSFHGLPNTAPPQQQQQQTLIIPSGSDNNNNLMNWTGQPQQQQQQQKQEGAILKPSLPIVKPMFSAETNNSCPISSFSTSAPASQGTAANSLFGSFPGKGPIVVNGGTGANAFTSSSPEGVNNPLMGPSPSSMVHNHYTSAATMVGNNNSSNINGDFSAESHLPGLNDSPEAQFNELLSNLLSTALPPSEELFDDDMSAGNISDFGATALQVADDGMLLP